MLINGYDIWHDKETAQKYDNLLPEMVYLAEINAKEKIKVRNCYCIFQAFMFVEQHGKDICKVRFSILHDDIGNYPLHIFAMNANQFCKEMYERLMDWRYQWTEKQHLAYPGVETDLQSLWREFESTNEDFIHQILYENGKI